MGQAKSGKVIDVLDPANEMRLATVAEGDAADIDAAVRAARKALEHGPWGRMTPSARGRMVHKIGDLILEHLDELAQLESLDNGKPFSVARVADVPLSADIFHYMSGWSTKLEGKHIPISHLVSPGEYLSFTRLEPIGVVGQIIPWNFPLLMAAWKLAPALACGCTVVLKVAEETPLSALRLGDCCKRERTVVVNIVRRLRRNRGRAAAHPDVHKVATGSTDVGRLIVQAASARLAQSQPGARRQIAQHHPGRCRCRRGGRGRNRRHLLQSWPVLQRGLSPVRAGKDF
jgi:phenylacetaldehyde dehydrogenase